MEIIISTKSKKPIYNQISLQIKNLIMTEKLKEEDSLPAMRALAKSLRVSVITVQRAYEDLQREGFVDSAVGRGTFVAKQDKEKTLQENLKLAEEHLQEAVRIGKDNGIELESLYRNTGKVV